MILSAVIPCHKPHFGFIPSLIADLQKQERLADEIVIALSQCDEADLKTIKENIPSQLQDYITWVPTEKECTAGANRQRGIAASRADVVAFCDADDVYHPARFRIACDIIEGTGAMAVVHAFTYHLPWVASPQDWHSYVTCQSDDLRKQTFGPEPYDYRSHGTAEPRAWDWTALKPGFCVAHGHAIVRMHAFDDFKYDDSNSAEDTRFLRSLLWEKNHIVAIDLPLSCYLQGRQLVHDERLMQCQTTESDDALANSSGVHYDFIEIGTADFDTLIDKATPTAVGLSIDPLQVYLDRLPDKPFVTKVCAAISNTDKDPMPLFHVPVEDLEKHKLPGGLKGCNSLGKPHPTLRKFLKQYNCSHLEKTMDVPVMGIATLLERHSVGSIDYLKLDTEGHDMTILQGLIPYCSLHPNLWPKVIRCETNILTPRADVVSRMETLKAVGYSVEPHGEDTVLRRQF